MARYRINTTRYVLKWPRKHHKVPKFNKIFYPQVEENEYDLFFIL